MYSLQSVIWFASFTVLLNSNNAHLHGGLGGAGAQKVF